MTSPPFWVLGIGAAVLALVAIVALSPAREAVPLADASLLRPASRRTTALRVTLVLLVAGALAAAYLLAPRPTGKLDRLVSGAGSTVVVLDLSQSVSDLVYREIARTLEGVVTSAGDEGRIGLVLFSDTAEEALPPGSKSSDLEPFIRYFRPRQERGVAAKPLYYRAAGPTQQSLVRYPVSPWFGRFSGGTQISTGLRVARVALERGGGAGRVLLVSDLAEANYDLPRLTRELATYEQTPGLDLRVVALPPATSKEKEVFRRIGGTEIVDSLGLSTGNATAGEPGRGVSLAFVAAVLALALVLGTRELIAEPLRFGSARTGEGRS